jgi:vitamin B12 transporter
LLSIATLVLAHVLVQADGGAASNTTDAARGSDATVPSPRLRGEGQGEGSGGPPPAVELPRVIEAVILKLPAELAARAGAEVPMLVTLDETGQVTAAEVVTPSLPEIDQPARAAALRLRFTPARRNGVATPARIRYQLPVAAPAPVVPPSPLPAPAPPVPPPPLPAPAVVPEAAVDVTVRGASAARRLRESAEAVTVVETERAQRESADLGEVLARTQGVSVRRSGGLGSDARLSLNGLTDEQIRFFLDGVPLDVAGFGLGMSNVPVNLVERVEIYRGVVPVRFGADALGGAVNLVSEERPRGTSASGSAQLGSFGTYRLTLAARHSHEPSGLFVAANGFLDHADNDYPVDVDVPDEKGRLSAARVHRFHDRYDAYGGGLELGVVNRPWARRLVLRIHGTRQDKEIQHNLVMSVPYGEARYWETVRGATLRYEQPRLWGSAFGTTAVLAFSRSATEFKDQSPFVYDWFGRRIRERARAGEIGEPTKQRIWQKTGLARLGLSFTPSPIHALRLAVSPTIVDRTGRDYLITVGRDPLGADRDYLAVTSGLEYQLDLFARRLESIAFAKSYLYRASSEESLPGGIFRRLEQDTHHLGYGEQLRWRITPSLWLKGSYEWATRLPSPYEVFGDGVLLLSNLRLGPERSHNGNLGLTLDGLRTPLGDLSADVNAFIRHADDLIVLLGNDMTQRYENVYTTRAQGVEVSAGWTSPGGYLVLDGNATWQSVRNESTDGAFRDFKGDRIPNRPWFFANGSARLQKANLTFAGDELSLGYQVRYVNAFFRGWESLGLRQWKQVVPDQTTHGLSLTYLARGVVTQTWSLELSNLTDARTYDFFGTQRPGRAFSAKVTAEY